jgi:peptide/nickel transport system substrate-binding protein
MSADNTSVTVRIRPGKFHSGKPIGADDIVAGVTRALDDTQTNSLNGSTRILVRQAEKLDDLTVRFDLTQAFPESTVTDWMLRFPIVDKDFNNPDALLQAPAGSGPFALAENEPGTRMLLRRNESYWQEGKPYLDEVEYRFFESQNALVAALQSGGIEGALFVTASLIRPLEMDFNVVRGFRGAQVGLMYLQADKPPFDNKLLRQAMLHAVDRDRVVRDAYFGQSEPALSVFGPVSPASLPEFDDYVAYDLGRAGDLIKQSGVTAASVSIPSSDPARFQVAQIMQADLATVGFDLQIKSADQTTFAADYRGGRNNSTMSATGNSMRTPWMVTNDAALSTGEGNFLWGGRPPAAWLDAVTQAQHAVTDADVLASYRQMNQVLLDEAWAIPLNVWQNNFILARPLQGLSINPLDMFSLTDAYLA